MGGDLLSPKSLDNMGAAIAACATRPQAEGVDLASYTIPEVVKDMESARMALSYSRINLLSGNHGTRVAQIYAYMHPESLHRSVMIGVNPPGHMPETGGGGCSGVVLRQFMAAGCRSRCVRPGRRHAQCEYQHAQTIDVPAH